MNEPLATPRPTTRAVPAAMPWRLLALCYDALPVLALLMMTSAVFLWLHGGRTVESDPVFGALEFAAMWLLVGAYFVTSWRRGGQTIGMRPWRLQVLGSDGRSAPLQRLCLRYAVASVIPGLCLLWAPFDAQRRGLHDMAADTLVVRLLPAGSGR